MFSPWKKSSIAFLTTIVTVGSFFSVLPAQAQVGVTITSDIPKVADDIMTFVSKGLKIVAQKATTQAVTYAMNKVAYDTAVWLASGGNGQSPLAFNSHGLEYLQSVGDLAAGSFIETFGKETGVDLCKIPDVKVNLALKIGLRTNILGPLPYGPAGKPNCSLSAFKDNWGKSWDSKFGSTGAIMKDFNATLSTDDSPLGIFGTATEKVNNKIAQEKTAATLDRIEGQGIKPKETKISNKIETPAPVVAESFKANTPDKEQKAKKDQVNAAIASDEPGILAVAASIFLDTLVSGVVKNFQDKGVLLGYCVTEACKAKTGDTGSSDSGLANSYSALYGGGGVAAAQANFNYLQSMTVSEQGYDIISQLNSYSENPGVYNNRIDESFVLALKQEDTGEPITIQEAVDRGWLNGDWELIPPSNPKNNDKLCYKTAFCYSNIQVLRQLRILPLGFEIAALRSDPDKPWKLKDLINPLNFNKCPPDPGVYDQNSPFCHLIDPNWVLKSPPAKCNALVYSSTLLAPNVPDRLQECVDLQTCVSYDASGKCKDFGYCTREKNTWRFAADKCSAQFTTCRAFQDANGKDVAYLYRTLDTAVCKQENVGCQAYSTSQDGKGSWVKAGMINTSGNADLAGTNSGVFFNNKLSKSCSASAEGCSAFAVAGATDTALFLKKAPDYLKCYDADPATAAVEWPKTQADLANVDPSPLCSNYAGVCVPDEVSCNFYTPTAGGDKLPGKFTPAEIVGGVVQKWNDQCDAKCVGYDTYREMPSNYSSGQDIEYMIPASGQVCAAQDEGCTAFTNVGASQGATDKLEYYSYLRPCVLPAKDPGKTYVTYEGTAVSGFQLKTYTLVENKDNALNGPIGAPKYFARTQTEIDGYISACNETNYKAGTASPDCRQFNDPAGVVYYRLLSKTVVVSAACTSYRLDNSDFQIDTTVTTRALCDEHQGFMDSNNQCRVCFQNGEYREGSCYYDGLPNGAVTSAGTSRSCSASVDTCRAFKGNAGNNIEQVFTDTFEVASTNALVDWTGVTLTAESTHAGEHSIVGNVATNIVRKVTLQTGQSYDLTFWAKGSVSTLIVRVGENNGSTIDVGTVASNDTWNAYHIGPFTYTGATASGQIIFAAGQGGSIFLDNVRLVRVKDFVYRVKKTLKVDAICDADQTDNLPGEALGCKAYTDPKSTQYNLVGFSYLCRDNAIGCTAVLDTKNTIDTAGGKASNVWLVGPGGSTPKVTIENKDYSCSIPVGDTGCYIIDVTATVDQIKAAVKAMVGSTGDGFVSSTVYVGSDTPAASPVYLVANQPATCNQADLGCMAVGAQRLTPHGYDFVTMTIKNDPANYDTQLCTNEAVGCNAYSDGADTRFFKDPAITGQKVCNYRTNVSVKTAGGFMISANGWFWKGVGVCKNDTKTYCSQDSDCSGSSCIGIGDQACYKDYLASGEYGLWSSANTKYDNFVGECPTDQDKCTEFVDHNDNNQKYNLIKDDKLTGGDCGDQVSQREGCALFDQTDNPNKFWNAGLTYTLSDEGQGKKVLPVDSQGGNDSNVIFRVVRDRVCGEWLACKYNRSVFDQKEGKYKDVCENVQRCDSSGKCGPQIGSGYANQTLTEGKYRSRTIGWRDMDYDGYSILNLFPIEELQDVNFAPAPTSGSAPVPPDYRLVKKIACGDGNAATLTDNCATGVSESSNSCAHDGPCGWQGSGICRNHSCVQTIDGQGGSSNVDNATTQLCRGYPEKDAPFPYLKFIKENTDYGLVNHCNETLDFAGSPTDWLCDCNYTKVNYGDVVKKYWNHDSPNSKDGLNSIETRIDSQNVMSFNTVKVNNVPSGICVGGTKGKPGQEWACNTDLECKEDPKKGDQSPGGTCQFKTTDSKFFGYKGYCLEPDTRSIQYGNLDQHNCLTWFPGRINGTPDLYNQSMDAGFNITAYQKGPFYCKDKELWSFVDKKRVTLTGFTDCNAALNSSGYVRHVNKAIQSGTAVSAETVWNQITGNSIMPEFDSNGDLVSGTSFVCDNSTAFGYKHTASSYIWNNHNNDYTDGRQYMDLGHPLEACGTAGYTPGNVVEISSEDDTSGDNEDYVTVTFDCVATSPQWTMITSPFTVDYLSYPQDSHDALRCRTLIQIADRPDEVVSATQNVWVASRSEDSNTLCLFDSTSLTTIPSGPYIVKQFNTKTCSLGLLVPSTLQAEGFPAYDVRNIRNIAYLQENFVQSKHFLTINILGNNYVSHDYNTTNYPNDIWDIRKVGNGRVKPQGPQVRTVGACTRVGSKDVCLEGPPGITLFANQQYYNGGTVKLQTDNSVVSMRFFAFAGNQQMPIRKLAVNWGDAAPDGGDNFISGDPSFYRNQRGALNGVCNVADAGRPDIKQCLIKNVFVDDAPGNPGQYYDTLGSQAVMYRQNTCENDTECQQYEVCLPGGNGMDAKTGDWFGIIQDKTCNSGPFQFKDHTYQCDKIVNADSYKNPNECPGGAGAYPGGCCMYQPKVFVQDNWGWCTGNCTKDVNGKDAGCYGNLDDSNNIDQCKKITNGLPQDNAWQLFGGADGKVIIPAE